MSEPSIAKLEADIAARRARLANTIDELTYRSQPKVIAERQKQAAQLRFADATQNADGTVRVEVVGALAAAAVVLIAWGVYRHGRR
ncbi:MAG: DUF3618 domain-containing protein [Actinomycetia bacterium]|nr:DUF3618 domain-containing protein [Actinomycetes bacterium]